MLPRGLPKHSLGWEVLHWCSTYLAQPDGDNMGEPWEFSDEQAMFIVWFYALDDHGRFQFRQAVLERPKGWGKSPLLAAISCAEFLGPTNFAGWDASGNAVGKQQPSPLVQIAAISDSQAENTYALCREMLAQGEVINEIPGLEIMLAKSTAPGGRKLEKVTASPRGREGNRATFAVLDETHLWVPAEKGPELFEAISRNLAKKDRRWVATTNAHMPGEDSVAEVQYDSYQLMLEGKSFDKAMLFDTREVFVDDIYDRDEAWPALRYVYGDAAAANGGWVNLERIWAEINDSATKEHVARRFYFNQHYQGESAWLNQKAWTKCYREDLKLDRNDKIALGFKGNIRNGAACIIACRLEDGALFNLSNGDWEKPENAPADWEIDVSNVDLKFRWVMNRYNVLKVVADAIQWQDYIGRWYADWPEHIEEFWTSNKTKMARCVEQFETAVETQRVLWNDKQISRHVLNCHMEEVPQGYTIRKATKESPKYISAAQAAVLALEAAVLAIEEGGLKDDDTGLYGF